MSLLVLNKVSAYYGQIEAIHELSISINPGEIVTLIGSNGAGKTTTLRAISNLVKTTGSIHFNGIDITNSPPHQIAIDGIAHVPEGRGIFPRLSVRENLEIGAFNEKSKRVINDRMAEVFSFFPRLEERLKQPGGTMSGGEQQMLAIGRALMMKPAIMLLDEPSMGLAPMVVQQIFRIIRSLNEKGMTVLLVEQNAYQALNIAHRGYVIQTGNIILEDKASILLGLDEVKEAYLA